MTTALEGGEGSASRPGRSLPPGKDPVPTVQEAGWAPGPVCTGKENLDPTGIRCPDCPARSQSLYRLRYSAHIEWVTLNTSNIHLTKAKRVDTGQTLPLVRKGALGRQWQQSSSKTRSRVPTGLDVKREGPNLTHPLRRYHFLLTKNAGRSQIVLK